MLQSVSNYRKEPSYQGPDHVDCNSAVKTNLLKVKFSTRQLRLGFDFSLLFETPPAAGCRINRSRMPQRSIIRAIERLLGRKTSCHWQARKIAVFLQKRSIRRRPSDRVAL